MTKHPMVKHSVINTTMHKADAFMQQKGHLDLIALESQTKKKKKHIMLKIIQNQYHQSASSLAA